MTRSSLAVLAMLFCSSTLARAQDPKADPKYQFAKPEEVKQVEWKASASAGFAAATGNANVITLSGGANASRNDGANKIALDLSGIYALTWLTQVRAGATVANTVDDVVEERRTTAGNFLAKLRYDRFIKKIHSLYLAGFVGLDSPASKDVFGGVQLGYAVLAAKTRAHDLSIEAGADYTGTRYATSDPVHMASARVFIGYTLTISESTTANASVEALINLHPVKVSDRDFGGAEASRLYAKLALTTKLWKALSFRASFGLRYDNAPAARAGLAFCAAGMPGCMIAADDPIRFNQKLDTLSEIGLVVNII